MSTKQNGFDTDGIAGNFSIMTLHLDDWKIVLIWRCLHYTIYTKNLENDKSDQFWKYPHWHQSSSSSSSCWQWGDSWNISHTIFAIFLFVAVGSFAGDGGVLEPTGSVNLKSSVFAVWISTRDSNRSEIEEIETTRIVERVERPSQQNRVIENCIDAGFLSTVHVGQYFMTEDTEEFSQFTESVACRQHILRKGQQLFDPKGWIRRRTKIGPVLEVITSCVVPIVEDHGLILSWKFLRIARHGHLLREEDGAIPLIHDNVFVQTILSSICITSDVQSIHSIVNSGWFWDAHLVSKCGRSWSKPALIQRMNQQIQPRRTRTHDTGRLYCSVLKLSVLENTCSASVPCTSMRDFSAFSKLGSDSSSSILHLRQLVSMPRCRGNVKCNLWVNRSGHEAWCHERVKVSEVARWQEDELQVEVETANLQVHDEGTLSERKSENDLFFDSSLFAWQREMQLATPAPWYRPGLKVWHQRPSQRTMQQTPHTGHAWEVQRDGQVDLDGVGSVIVWTLGGLPRPFSQIAVVSEWWKKACSFQKD